MDVVNVRLWGSRRGCGKLDSGDVFNYYGGAFRRTKLARESMTRVEIRMANNSICTSCHHN